MYKKKLSNFNNWAAWDHAEDYLVFPENIGNHLSIDEVSLSKGELYTFVTNKAAKGKKGSIVASIKGTLSADIIKVLQKIPEVKRRQVDEITLDMASNMEHASKHVFPFAIQTTDRFHVVRLAMEALQHLRIKHRWAELDKENEEIQKAKTQGLKYKVPRLSNGDTPKQLLTRSRYIIARREEQWTESQLKRASILFKLYPEIKKAYQHTIALRNIYNNQNKANAQEHFKHWIKTTQEAGLETFNTVANTIENKLDTILNFFEYRNTNANAKSFITKIKLFRANLRAVADTKFFLFRLTKLFA